MCCTGLAFGIQVFAVSPGGGGLPRGAPDVVSTAEAQSVQEYIALEAYLKEIQLRKFGEFILTCERYELRGWRKYKRIIDGCEMHSNWDPVLDQIIIYFK